MIITLILVLPLYVAVGCLWGSQKRSEMQDTERHLSLEKQMELLETAIRKVITSVEIMSVLDHKNKEKEQNGN